MEMSDYWTNFWRRRIGRRRVLTGAALAGSGLAAAALVGCEGDGGAPSGSPAPRSSPTTAEAVYPHDARQAVVPAPPGMNGGTLHYVGFDPVVVDRYDPHQTAFGPQWSSQSAVFSKLYAYTSHEEPTWGNIVPDLAEDAPEMIGDPPDTYVIRIRRGVKFHDNERIRRNFPALAGRELTADDVIYSIERQRNLDSPNRAYFFRASHYTVIDKVEKVDDYTIRITTKGPVAPFYNFLANTSAFIIPRETVDQAADTMDVSTGPKPEERMIGTGPFMWEELKWGIEFKAVRNPAWFGWGDASLGRPYLDSYVASGTGLQDGTAEAFFREKKIDVGSFVENPSWVFGLKEEIPELVLHRPPISGWVQSAIQVNCAPFNDVRLRKAFHLATDRQQVIDVIWKGEGQMVGPVGAAIKYWALPQEELESLPGYRQGPEREQDIADAVAAYEAAGRPPLPEMWFADVPSYIPAYSKTYGETMRKNLGTDLKIAIRPYISILESFVRADCERGLIYWGFNNGSIDLDDWVYPFRTGEPRNLIRLSDPELDVLLDDQRREFNAERRRELGYEIQRYLLGVTGDKPGAYAALPYATLVQASVSWPYYKNRVSFPWFGNSYWLANVWLDRNDAAYVGRPT